ncbi:MAG: L,D-transpeptidase family protein [Chlorobi bacterium]|nr:L,D-transpeptidase family protein [Chlorobiota bacterium]
MRKTLFFVLALPFFWVVGFSRSLSLNQIIENKIEAGIQNHSISADGVVLYAQDLIADYYELNDYAPVWRNKKNFKELMANLEDAYNEGLMPGDYHLDRIKRLIDETKGNNADPNKLADRDLLMTDGLFIYGKDLILGKVDQSKIRPGWDVPTNELPGNGDSLLYAALENKDLTGLLNSLKPDNFMYVHLRNGLKHYREIAKNGGWPKIPEGQVLKPGMKDKRVLAIRDYLEITGDLPVSVKSENDSINDDEVVKAVKEFQFRHNLNQDGVIGKGTLGAMNVTVEERIDDIRVNMERARWVMHHLPDDFLVVNIAGYNVRRVINDSIVYYSRAIVGKQYHESPIFKGKMRYIVLNPTWTLPHSIATKETLPKLQKNPNYLTEKNMIIMDRSGKEIDPSTIDFNKLSQNNFPYIVRQTAGPHNALGQVKFIFPNKYSVYLHDTPSRSLFANEKRAFSHGCIRLDKKWELLIDLMGEPDVWNMDKINEVLASGKTTRVNLKNPIDIVLLYWTAGADKQDKLYFNKDVYGRDAAVLKELDKPFARP